MPKTMGHWQLIALAVIMAGCRADVEGYWVGSVGETPALLALEQAGSVVRGKACIDDACDAHARGELTEERLTLTLGCLGCEAPPRVTLDLEVTDDEMAGIAILEGCSCTTGVCACSQPAAFQRTASYSP